MVIILLIIFHPMQVLSQKGVTMDRNVTVKILTLVLCSE